MIPILHKGDKGEEIEDKARELGSIYRDLGCNIMLLVMIL